MGTSRRFCVLTQSDLLSRTRLFSLAVGQRAKPKRSDTGEPVFSFGSAKVSIRVGIEPLVDTKTEGHTATIIFLRRRRQRDQASSRRDFPEFGHY